MRVLFGAQLESTLRLGFNQLFDILWSSLLNMELEAGRPGSIPEFQFSSLCCLGLAFSLLSLSSESTPVKRSSNQFIAQSVETEPRQ